MKTMGNLRNALDSAFSSGAFDPEAPVYVGNSPVVGFKLLRANPANHDSAVIGIQLYTKDTQGEQKTTAR